MTSDWDICPTFTGLQIVLHWRARWSMPAQKMLLRGNLKVKSLKILPCFHFSNYLWFPLCPRCNPKECIEAVCFVPSTNGDFRHKLVHVCCFPCTAFKESSLEYPEKYNSDQFSHHYPNYQDKIESGTGHNRMIYGRYQNVTWKVKSLNICTVHFEQIILGLMCWVTYGVKWCVSNPRRMITSTWHFSLNTPFSVSC